MNNVLVLAGKDLFLHWQALLGSWATIIGGYLALTFIRTPVDANEKMNLLMNFSVIFAMLYGQWLVDLEKTNRTFGLTRTLPVSDDDVVTAKFLSSGVMQSGSYCVPMAVLVSESWLPEYRWRIVLTWLVVNSLGATLMVGKWVLGPRLGQAIVGVFGLSIIGIVIWIRRTFGEAAIPRENPVFLTAFGASLVAWTFLMWALTCRFVRSRDTADLMR